MSQTFNELYKFYQSNMLETIELAIKNQGWLLTKRSYRSNYSKDIATLELHIENDPTNSEGTFCLEHIWMEFLFIDRDEILPQIDFKILDKNYGLAKIEHLVSERIEVLDALLRNDREKLHILGKHLGRLRSIDKKSSPKSKTHIYYENGVEMPKEES